MQSGSNKQDIIDLIFCSFEGEMADLGMATGTLEPSRVQEDSTGTASLTAEKKRGVKTDIPVKSSPACKGDVNGNDCGANGARKKETDRAEMLDKSIDALSDSPDLLKDLYELREPWVANLDYARDRFKARVDEIVEPYVKLYFDQMIQVHASQVADLDDRFADIHADIYQEIHKFRSGIYRLKDKALLHRDAEHRIDVLMYEDLCADLERYEGPVTLHDLARIQSGPRQARL